MDRQKPECCINSQRCHVCQPSEHPWTQSSDLIAANVSEIWQARKAIFAQRGKNKNRLNIKLQTRKKKLQKTKTKTKANQKKQTKNKIRGKVQTVFGDWIMR